MKTVQKMFFAIALVSVLASCQSSTDANQTLSKPDTRKVTMETIANDSSMCSEMMDAMMNGKNGKMVMMQHHSSMMKMMKADPSMMKGMMGDMMDMCKDDTTMMAEMCKKMMENPKMMDMMHKMEGKKMDMNNMKGMDHTKH
jgi:hypothetical protein